MTKALLLLIVLLGTTALAQTIQNPGFETPRDTNRTLPAGWRVPKTAVNLITLDSTGAQIGTRSLKITRTADSPDKFTGFSQTCSVALTQPTIMHLRASVKTEAADGVALWCQVWGDNDKAMLGFANSDMQNTSLSGTASWRELDLVLTVSPQTRRFVFGGFISGTGRAWFDNVRFETRPAETGEPSAKVKAYMAKAISIVKKHALVRDSIPWPQIETELMTYARGMQMESETYPVIGYLLNVMRKYGDNHSHFQPPLAVKNLQADKPNDEGPQPQARYLGDGVGYVAVPRFWGVNAVRELAFAKQIQRLIRSIDSAQTVTSWVVDLRQNGGGNMYPMIAGLGPLTGEGTLGYFSDGKQDIPWGYRNGESYEKKPGTGTRVPTPYRLRKEDARVAVLIGPGTGSSGEMTALSFMGRPDTRFFGLPSGGYTTANEAYNLPDKAQLYLAVAVSADRNHKKYPRTITPDEEIKTPATATTDPTLDAAKAWLTKK